MKRLEWILLKWMATCYVEGVPQAFPCFKDDGFHGPWAAQGVAKQAVPIAKRWIKEGWLVPDSYGNYRLTPEARKIAVETPEPVWEPAAPSPLTAFDYEVLAEVAAWKRWVYLSQIGVGTSSKVSTSLDRLVYHGLLELRSRSQEPVTGLAAAPRPSLFGIRRGSGRQYRAIPVGVAIGSESLLAGKNAASQ